MTRSRSLTLRSTLTATALVGGFGLPGLAAPDTTAPGAATTAELSGELHVSAAASLTDVYTQLEAQFEAAHPDVDVIVNFAASSELVAQITEGAPADVFASADLDNMTKLIDAELIAGTPTVFATNRLAIAVEAGNPEAISGLDDLADRPELIVVSCDADVPIGRYTQEVLDSAGLSVEFDSYEENVRAVAGKVELGEADAGIVYATDITATDGKLDSVELPAEFNVIAVYPIAVTAEAGNPDAATAFIDHVLGVDGQTVLADAGFGSPDEAPAPAATTVPAASVSAGSVSSTVPATTSR